MMMIEISEHKLDKATDYAEKMLKYGGKLMSCLSDMGEEYGMNYREHEDYGRYGKRSGMNYRDDEWDEDEMSERRSRRRRDSMGRYR